MRSLSALALLLWLGVDFVRAAAPARITVRTSGGRTKAWDERTYDPADLWAYQPIQRRVVPQISNLKSQISNPIDYFVLARLQARGLRPAPAADRRTLLRRLTFDLHGLPPTQYELETFVRDRRPDAYARVVRRLLASPHYGEQQARHWLDVARYADTSGFSNDFERPHAWRYRDYVVRSFDADKPFDRFVLEQLAGDELDATDPELLIAIGFLRAGPWEHTGMTVAAVTRQDFLDDVTHHVGVTLLAQGLRCARCHDHKFDPVPTRDYYRMQAIFAATQFAERAAPFLPGENLSGFSAGRAVTQQRLAQLREQQAALRQRSEVAVAAWLRERGVQSVEDLPPAERPKRDYLGYTVGLSKTDLSLRKVYQKSEAYLERELQRCEPRAFSVYSGVNNNYTSVRLLNPMPARLDGPVPPTMILIGGALATPAEAVDPGVLSVLSDSPMPTEPRGRRLALVRWMVARENPLTARVIVNRIWQQHFGRGLVATPNNFGKMGAKPTHPELLDWLATWFMEQGWSIKRLHELIVSSRTYQQNSDPDPSQRSAETTDPGNTLLWRFPARRLAAEELRDAMLAATGELNREVGGPAVFPELNWEVALQPRHIMGSVAPAYLPSRTPAERNRRTLYAFRCRTLPDPLLESFNRPGTEVSCEARDATIVAPQALALFNSDFAHDRALALAVALERAAATTPARVTTAFRRVLGRAPTASEQAQAMQHVERMAADHRGTSPPPTELPSTIRRQMIEELTGEEVEWEEQLDFTAYVRDLKPWQVSPPTRALADLCLVLMNSNEFVYVR